MRARAPIVFLAASLGLIAVLTWQAIVADRDHRALAERVLRDYADLAATEFMRRASPYVFTYGFDVIGRALPRARRASGVPSRDELAEALPPPSKRAIELVGSIFRINTSNNQLDVRGDALPELTEQVLLQQARSPFERRGPVTLLSPPSDGPTTRLFVLANESIEDASDTIVLGVEISVPALAAWIQEFALGSPLLPPVLMLRVPDRSAFSAVVKKAVTAAVVGHNDQVIAGAPLSVTSTRYSASRSWRDEATGRLLPGFGVVTTIDPEIAPSLIIGGVPESRVIPLLGLLVLATALAIASVLQLRRERRLAAMREDFVTRTSHELRTPIARMRIFSETLLLDRVRTDAERHDAVRAIDRAARRLSLLVENVLQFSRSRAGGSETSVAPGDVGAIVREAVSDLQSSVSDERAVTIDAPAGINALVDRETLRQAIVNVVDNAWKYGGAGQPIEVGVAIDADEVRIRVSDAGPGIPARDRERVWEPYVRLDRDRRSAIAGTGIGLAVVHDVVTAHRGRCWIEPSNAGGTTVVIALPLAVVPQPQTSSVA